MGLGTQKEWTGGGGLKGLVKGTNKKGTKN